MADETDEIKFNCQVVEVKVMRSDSGIRVILDLPETAIPEMALLAESKRRGWTLDAVLVPVIPKDTGV